MSKSLKASFKTLEDESIKLSQILNALNEAIIAFSPQLIVTHINPTYREYFPEENNINLNSSLNDLQNTLLASHIYSVNNDGQERSLNLETEDRKIKVNFLPVAYQEDILESSTNELSPKYGVVCLFKDITQEERLEKTRKDYVANVSHELKTPITAMRCLIEPMIDGIIHDQSDLQKYYQIIYNETLRLSRLIDDILELSRIQTVSLI